MSITITSIRCVLSFFVFAIVLVGCESPPLQQFNIETVNLIDRSIPIAVYGKDAEVVIDWMHENNYGLRQTDFELMPVFFDFIPDPRNKIFERDYHITQKRKIVTTTRRPKNPKSFRKADHEDITLEVYQNHLIIRIKDVGQARLPIASLDNIGVHHNKN